MPENLPTIAAFDFDGTLTYQDSLVPFLFYAAGTSKALLKILKSVPVLSAYCLGLESRQSTKEYVLTKFFKEMPFDELQALGKSFAANELDKYLRPTGMHRLQWHLQQAHTCILISASLELYLRPWAESKGFSGVIASILAVDRDAKITGKLFGQNCWGPEKTHRLQKILGDRNNYLLYAYGDSRGDQELLEMADFPYYRKFT